MNGFGPVALDEFPMFVGMVAGLVGLILLGEALRKWAGWSSDATRRLIHAGTGLFVAGSPFLFDGPEWLYVLCGLFIPMNWVAVRKRWFKSMHGIQRPSWGTVTFPLALLAALFLCWWPGREHVFALQSAFVVLALADPFASWAGTRAGHKLPLRDQVRKKTWAGSIAFCAMALGVSVLVLAGFKEGGGLSWSWPLILGAALGTALLSTAVEVLGSRGWDNFFIVVTVAFWLLALEAFPEQRSRLFLSLGVGIGFGLVAWRLRLLNASGTLAGSLLAVTLVGLGGIRWVVPGFTFFFLSSLLSKAGRGRKRQAEALAEKGHQRDAGQVYANSGVAWLQLLVFTLYPWEGWYWGYVAAFSAATADTWATEIGTLFKRRARLITTGQPVPAGTSGGVSWTGTLGAVAGALVIWGSVWLVAPQEVIRLGVGRSLLGVVLGGLIGSMVDSLLGATVQAGYRDDETGALTEQAARNGRPNPFVKGFHWIDNDRVNWGCTLAGSVVGLLVVLGL